MSGSKDSTQVQTNEPYAGQKPFLEYGFSQAQDQLQNLGFFPNSTYAGWNPLQTQAMNMGENYATGALSDYVGNMMGANQRVASGELMDVANNPWIAQYAEAATRPIQQNLMEQALPMIRNSAIGAGQYGGSRQDMDEGLAVGRAAQAMGDVTSNIYNQAYGQNLNAMLGAQAMSPQMAQMGMMPSNILSGIGGQQQWMQQQEIDEQMARHYYPQTALQNYMNTVGGQLYGSQQSTPYSTSPLAGGLGGAMAGSYFGLPGMMIGGALGAFA